MDHCEELIPTAAKLDPQLKENIDLDIKSPSLDAFETENEIKSISKTELSNQSSSLHVSETDAEINSIPKITTPSTEYLKINGDHSPNHHTFLNNEESCSSSSRRSSSSSRNLVIDHPEDSQEENILKKSDRKKLHLQGHNLKRKLCSDSEQIKRPGPNQKTVRLNDDNFLEKSSLTASIEEEDKLDDNLEKPENNLHFQQSTTEVNESSATSDKDTLSSLNLNTEVTDKSAERENETLQEQEASSNKNKEETHDNCSSVGEINSFQLPHRSNLVDSLQHDTQYLNIKPSLTYKCFKCSKNFNSILELRDHQKLCLFKKHISYTNDNISREIFQLTNNNFSQQFLSSQLQKGIQNELSKTAQEKKKVFVCSICGLYYEYWSLFLHMRDMHKKLKCVYCDGIFSSAERLTLHLEMNHDLEQNHFDSQEKLRRSSKYTCYLMCCICDYLFTEHDNFSDHNCCDLMKPCPLCGQKGKHSTDCKASQTLKSLKSKRRLKRNNKSNKSEATAHMSVNENLNSNLDTNRTGGGDITQLLGTLETVCDKEKQNENFSQNFLSSRHVKMNGCINDVGKQPPLSPPSVFSNELDTPMNSNNSNQSGHQDGIQQTNINNINNSIENDQLNVNSNQILVDDNINNNSSQEFSEKITDLYKNKDSDDEQKSLTNSQTVNSLPQEQISLIDQYLSEQRRLVEDLKMASSRIINDEKSAEEPRLFVPKFKLKIPKEYQQAALESDNTSNESSDEDQEEQGEQEESEQKNDEQPMNVPEPMDVPQSIDVPQSMDNPESIDVPESMNISQPITVPETMDVPQSIDVSQTMDVSKESLPSEHLEKNNENVDMIESENQQQITEQMKSENEGDSETQQTDISYYQNDVGLLVNKTADQDGEQGVCIDKKEENKIEPEDGIKIADEDVPVIDLTLSQPLDKIPKLEFLRICLRATYPICLYCNHARRIAVSGHSFALHLIAEHRFAAIVDSITAEELLPSTIVNKLKELLPELTEYYFNLETYCNVDNKNLIACYEKIFECFQCRFETRIHKELYLHNRKMHLRTAILCFMCKSNFFNYNEILCHMCPGEPNKFVIFDIKFRCCLCNMDMIPSAFRLMVHLRKAHFACDVCLEDCQTQSKLSSHVWKHKLHHLCYRCGIAYRNKSDITKHLFWKHGTESVLCKRCLQKRWPHVYHFCIPPQSFTCEICNLTFSRAIYLKVHKRLHSGDAPYPCTEDNCDQKFISRKLLLKHVAKHTEVIENKPIEPPVENETEAKDEPDTKEIKEDIKNEKICDENEIKDTEITKKKKKKLKKDVKSNIDDLMNLPAPNLSESDSSEDDESLDKTIQSQNNINSPKVIPNVMLSPLSDTGEDDSQEINHAPVMDIWENFKAFQASQKKKEDDDDKQDDLPPIKPILHIAQSDHDYCMLFRKNKNKQFDEKKEIKMDDELLSEEKPKDEEKENGKDRVKEEEEADKEKEGKLPSDHLSIKSFSSPEKKQKSEKTKSGSDSSSDSSSGSDSSCSCGSNCSCSSSSSSSSGSSSSSEDSDSSTSEGRRRVAAKRAAKEEKRKRVKSDDSSKANGSDIVDVVTTDGKSIEILNAEPFIQETDLETDESDTDEDFYDEHPQKLATQLLAEKRRQLMMQTCLSPSHNFDIVENSRPSTPSLPEEMMKEKKVKIKKKKRERKTPKNTIVSSFKMNIPSDLTPNPEQNISQATEIVTPVLNTMTTSFLDPPTPFTEVNVNTLTPTISNLSSVVTSTPTAAPITTIQYRLSTGSNSDAETPLKRSKRTRRPNKFYGYSSDDESMSSSNYLTGPAAFKPIPPPNFTWRKEDLPTPPSKSKGTKSGSHLKKSSSSLNTSINTSPLPPIPPIIIRPSSMLPPKPPGLEQSSPVVEPLRIPISVTSIHHNQSPQIFPFSRDSQESESSDEDRLHISLAQSHRNSGRQSKKTTYSSPMASVSNYGMTSTSSQLLPTPVPKSTPPPPQPPQRKIPPALLPNPDFATLQYFNSNNIRYPIRPPIGARTPREGESIYCYCRCPYDEISEMIACDGENCLIEWFHFECVGILVPPKGKWFCPECRQLYPNEMFESSADENIQVI